MPGIKRDVPERCPKCGQKDAELRGNQVAWGLHKCPHWKKEYGPSAPPRLSSVRDVNFVPYEPDFCPDCGSEGSCLAGCPSKL